VHALSENPESSSAERVRQLAREFGRNLGKQAPASAPHTGRPRERLAKLLSGCGYEPKLDADGGLRLHNCPFYSLAAEYRSTVCQVNLALHEGLIEGVGALRWMRAELQPAPGMCCVAVVRAGPT